MNKIKYLEFNNKGQLIRVVGVCKAKDLKRLKEERQAKEKIKDLKVFNGFMENLFNGGY